LRVQADDADEGCLLSWHTDRVDIETQMDLAVGRFIREVAVLEVMLQLVAGAVWRDEQWVERSLGSAADHVKSVRAKLAEFPSLDQAELDAQLSEAEWVWKFRRALVHGRWTLLDAATEEYVSERPLPKSEARDYTSRPGWETDYPEISLRFNLRSVTGATERMRQVQAYLEANLERWEESFGVEFDAELFGSESARIEALRRAPRLYFKAAVVPSGFSDLAALVVPRDAGATLKPLCAGARRRTLLPQSARGRRGVTSPPIAHLMGGGTAWQYSLRTCVISAANQAGRLGLFFVRLERPLQGSLDGGQFGGSPRWHRLRANEEELQWGCSSSRVLKSRQPRTPSRRKRSAAEQERADRQARLPRERFLASPAVQARVRHSRTATPSSR